MNKETAKDQLLKLYESQIVDLTMMSKIELGDDVIKEIHRLKGIIQDETTEREEITVEELKRDIRQRVAILTYRGDGDPVSKLDKKVREYTNGKEYWEFIDMNMDNPWTRIIVFGEL
jgi:hypothetical protein